MRYLLTGSTGLIASHLIPMLVARGDQVLAHTRRPRPPSPGVFWLTGDSADAHTFAQGIGTVDAVINLAGAPIATRWTPSHRAAIIKSRVATTQALVQAMQGAAKQPAAWVNASAVGFYGATPEGQCDEAAPQGTGFLAEVCGAWEAAAAGVGRAGVPLHLMRLGVVLANEGGMLPNLTRAVRAFAGGPMGSGEQWLSWVHVTDAVRMMLWALDGSTGGGHATLAPGPINVVAPNPARQAEVMARIGRILRRPIWLPVPAWAAKVALGDMADETLFASQQVVPKQALSHGFNFSHPHLDGALRQLLVPG